ncbi:MAG: PaaI family thioesterase [Sphingomonadales bacterium]|nr:PaaI family thioesterase [Sphingomonadales bacterium]
MSEAAPAFFHCAPHPDHPGWQLYQLSGPERYNRAVLGDLLVRAEDDSHARVRLAPQPWHANSTGRYHGGITLGLIDVALFAAMYVLRAVPVSGSVTVDMQTQFIGAGDAARALDCVVELLRETRRMGFLRGLVVQADDLVASFTATVRKPQS